ncbi:MAG: transposase [Chloroflexota bacterium]|nr:transposase [Chloroflexota bacterium]
MRLVVNLKLLPAAEQDRSLGQTLERANAACNAISATAWQERVFGQYRLHKLLYYSIKAEFGLTAQMVVRCIAKVADAYKMDRKAKRTFRPLGSIAYDDRILRFLKDDRVSIWTVSGRQTIAYTCGERQRALLPFRAGETDLVHRDGKFYLNVVCEVDEPPLLEATDVLGVDLGIVNIAADSDGATYSGGQVNGLRKRHAKLRARLQSRGTRSATRLLKKRSRKESRFARDVNHRISKRLVAKAQCTKRAIALENLQGIRSRIKVRRPQRRQQHSWAFFQLRSFVEYKARLAGVPIVLVDPHYTSQTCPGCGHVASANRKTQALFSCTSCGLAGPADVVAAENIRVLGRALVNAPYVPPAQGSGRDKLPALAGSG